MHFLPIKKNVASMPVQPNLLDYDKICAGFSWKEVRHEFSGLPNGRGLNIAHEAVDRHADGPRSERVAIRCLGKDGTIVDLTYGGLKERSNRFANLLDGLGVTGGERVFWLAGRIPALYPVVLRHPEKPERFLPSLFRLWAGADFSASGAGQCQGAGHHRAAVQQENRSASWTGCRNSDTCCWSTWSVTSMSVSCRCRELMEGASSDFTIPATDPEDMAILHFTSGTTGMPKGAVHVHNAVHTHYITGKYVLDLHPDDIFWCTADPGWVTGTSYGIIAPLTPRVTSIVDEADFDSERWYRILEEQRVTVWYTAPTAIRMLMRAPEEQRQRYDLSRAAAGAQRRRTAQPGGGPLGRAGSRAADSRQLVADGNRRHHDRQLCCPGNSPRFHGAAVAGDRGRHCHPP